MQILKMSLIFIIESNLTEMFYKTWLTVILGSLDLLRSIHIWKSELILNAKRYSSDIFFQNRSQLQFPKGADCWVLSWFVYILFNNCFNIRFTDLEAVDLPEFVSTRVDELFRLLIVWYAFCLSQMQWSVLLSGTLAVGSLTEETATTFL